LDFLGADRTPVMKEAAPRRAASNLFD
jgi:hypothetical protein